ncbi:hypothetical protein [Streptomyces sp. NPDC003077]|uniref:Rv1733c family protein n=1 Tax=Streptomyces sp. NPDC003077 TaxID=3154443 RepID=UPI0033B14BC0
MTLLLVLGAPGVGVAAATIVYGAQSHVVERQAQERSRVPAVLLRDGVSARSTTGADFRGTHQVAPAHWTAPDGTPRTGTIEVGPDLRKGSRTSVWVRHDGQLVSPPLSRNEALTSSISAGLWTGAATALVFLGIRWWLRRCLDARRLADWDRRWAETGPLWNGENR